MSYRNFELGSSCSSKLVEIVYLATAERFQDQGVGSDLIRQLQSTLRKTTEAHTAAALVVSVQSGRGERNPCPIRKNFVERNGFVPWSKMK